MNGPPGLPVSLDGHTRVGLEQCANCGGARLVFRDGQPIGVYVDDTTPLRRKWVSIALLHHPPPQTVFVGIGPEEQKDTLEDNDIGVPHVNPPQLIRLKEWLPWGMGDPWRSFGKVRPCGPGNGYILQYDWFGYLGRRRPSLICRRTCTRQARRHKPRFIFHV